MSQSETKRRENETLFVSHFQNMQKLDSQNMQKTEILSEKLVILSLEPLSYCIITKKYPSLHKNYTPYPLSEERIVENDHTTKRDKNQTKSNT